MRNYYLHFTDEEIETLSDLLKVTQFKSWSQDVFIYFFWSQDLYLHLIPEIKFLTAFCCGYFLKFKLGGNFSRGGRTLWQSKVAV